MKDFDERILKEFKEMEIQMGRFLRNASLPLMMTLQSGCDWQPAVDIYETDKEIYVYMDLADVAPETLSVKIDRGLVTISGERRPPCHLKIRRIHQLEIEHGRFKRSIALPVPVDAETTSSRCKNGLLEIKLPRQMAKRKIRINVGKEK